MSFVHTESRQGQSRLSEYEYRGYIHSKKVIENVFIGSTTLIAEDVMGNYIENLFNFLMVKGDEYKSPSDYYDAFSTKWNVLWRSGFRVGSALLREK